MTTRHRRSAGGESGIPAGIWILLGLAVLLGVLSAWIPQLRDPSSLLQLVGGLHPLLVHLPIGILLLALIMEALNRFGAGRFDTTPIFWMGALCASLAVVSGLLLSQQGNYDPELLGWHQWLGTGVAFLAIGLCLVRFLTAALGARFPRRTEGVLLSVMLIGLLGAGYLGGTMAHGSGYLTRFLPDFLEGWIPGAGSGRRLVDVRQAVIYEDLVRPILQKNCVGCHGPAKKEGGLQLDSWEGLQAGGESGPVISAGQPDASEVYRRITLPLYESDRMPPDGEPPLSVEDTELIRWWIEQGAVQTLRVAQARDIPASVQTTLNRLSVPEEERRTGIFALEMESAEPQLLDKVREAGFAIAPVAQEEPWLEVAVADKNWSEDKLEQLLPIAPQVAWLDLGGTPLTDGGAASLKEFRHLVHLHLENTGVTDQALAPLKELKHLEYLNLYGTQVSDAGLRELAGLENLQKLYVWKTQVTAQGARSLEKERPGLKVELGIDPSAQPDSESAGPETLPGNPTAASPD